MTGEPVYIGMILYPRVRLRLCHLCGSLFSLAETGPEPWSICPDCRDDLKGAFTPFELSRLEGHPHMPLIALSVIALSVYEGPLPGLMEAIKLRRHFRLLHFVAPAMDQLPGTLVPLPASARGRRARGFDQTRVLAARCGRPVATVVRRRRGSEQKHLSRTDRVTNAERSLYLRGTPPPGAILLDDVTTTGATIHRAVTLLDAADAPPAAVIVVSARI